MDKAHWFPVWSGTKENPVKVVCNCDGFEILSKVGFVKNLSELANVKKEKAKAVLNESGRAYT
jgi:hypothetical protein